MDMSSETRALDCVKVGGGVLVGFQVETIPRSTSDGSPMRKVYTIRQCNSFGAHGCGYVGKRKPLPLDKSVCPNCFIAVEC